MTGPFSLDGRIILVTGASRGLGRAMAASMAEAGGTVILNGRDETALAASAAAIGHGAEIQAFDVADEAASVAAVRDIERRHGRLDVLVSNAGIQHRQKITELKTEDWRRMLATHLDAAFILAREAARGMIARRSGRIIMTASMMGPRLARPTIAPYVSAKAGLMGLTHALANELGPHGITCNAIAPGFFATEMNTALVENAEFTRMVEQRTPLGRWGEPREIGNVAVFLASDAASYVNGHTLYVDGGLTAAL